jgi:putative tRNA adenosine deaminase-associated protein
MADTTHGSDGHFDDRPGLEDIEPDLESDDSDDEFDDDLDDEDFDEFDDEDDSDDEDDDEDDEDDELEDATEDDIDFVIACYREDGVATAQPLDAELANDLDDLISELQRIPGDAGALGMVSIDGEVLVTVRVRGHRHIQVMASDVYYADEWPIVRDVADYLDLDDETMPEDGPIGDLNIFADQGLSEMDLEAICLDDEELSSDDLAIRIARAIRYEKPFQQAVDDYWSEEEDDD